MYPGKHLRRSECRNRISSANFLMVFHSNYGNILRSFQDMTMGRITDDGQTSEIVQRYRHIFTMD